MPEIPGSDAEKGIQRFLLSQLWKLDVKVWAGPVRPEAVGEDQAQTPLGLETAGSSLCLLTRPSLCAPLSLSFSVQISPFRKDTSHTGYGVCPTPV